MIEPIKIHLHEYSLIEVKSPARRLKINIVLEEAEIEMPASLASNLVARLQRHLLLIELEDLFDQNKTDYMGMGFNDAEDKISISLRGNAQRERAALLLASWTKFPVEFQIF